MKVYLVSKNAEGEAALQKILSMWRGRQKFRMLRIMGNRVHFQKIEGSTFKVQYSQIDFNTLPKMDEYCKRVELNVYQSLAMYGVARENVDVVFE